MSETFGDFNDTELSGLRERMAEAIAGDNAELAKIESEMNRRGILQPSAQDGLIALLARAWDAGFLDGYDNGSSYGAEGNCVNPYIPGDVAGGVYDRGRTRRPKRGDADRDS